MKSKRKLFGLIAVGLVAAASGFLMTGGLEKIKGGAQDSAKSAGITDTLISVVDHKPSMEIVAPGTSELPTRSDSIKSAPSGSMRVKVSRNPIANADGTYSFSVIASDIPLFTNVIYTFNQGRRGWVTSSTGSFTGVSPDSHAVTVYALAKRNGELAAKAETRVSGFDKLANRADNDKTTTEKPSLSVAQVAAMFRNHDPQLRYPDDHQRHPLIAKQINLSFSGLRSGDAKPQVINDIYDKLNFGLWQSARVVSLSYDSNNKVNGIHFTVTYPD